MRFRLVVKLLAASTTLAVACKDDLANWHSAILGFMAGQLAFDALITRIPWE